MSSSRGREAVCNRLNQQGLANSSNMDVPPTILTHSILLKDVSKFSASAGVINEPGQERWSTRSCDVNQGTFIAVIKSNIEK